MVYLEGLLANVRATGNFRKVLHTGLYSQLVAMEVPVGGDIGDEVCTLLPPVQQVAQAIAALRYRTPLEAPQSLLLPAVPPPYALR